MTKEKLLNFSRLSAVWLFWPALAVVVWGELSATAGVSLHLWDKLEHFTAYFGLTALAYVALLGRTRRGLAAALALVVLGGVLEVVQGMIGRDMSLYDEFANTLGVVSGFGAGWVYAALLGGVRLVDTRRQD